MSTAVVVKCPHCRAEGTLADPSLSGQWIACPACQQTFQAPIFGLEEPAAPLVPGLTAVVPELAIVVTCPLCQAPASLGDPAFLGQWIQCPTCQQPYQAVLEHPSTPLEAFEAPAATLPEASAGAGDEIAMAGDSSPAPQSIQSLCPNCQAGVIVTDTALLGQWIQCPTCQQPYQAAANPPATTTPPASAMVNPAAPFVEVPVPEPTPLTGAQGDISAAAVSAAPPAASVPPAIEATAPLLSGSVVSASSITTEPVPDPAVIAPAAPLPTAATAPHPQEANATVPAASSAGGYPVQCPHCRVAGNLPDASLLGQWIACPACQQTFQAPAPPGLTQPVPAQTAVPAAGASLPSAMVPSERAPGRAPLPTAFPGLPTLAAAAPAAVASEPPPPAPEFAAFASPGGGTAYRAAEPRRMSTPLILASSGLVVAILVISIMMFAMGDPVRRMTRRPQTDASPQAPAADTNTGPQESAEDVFARINALNAGKGKE